MKKKNKNFISDGYTAKGYVKATELNDEFRFEYRPFLIDKRAALWKEAEKIAETKPDLGEAKIAMGLVHQLVSWDITDDKGKPVDITARNILRLAPVLYARLGNIIGGWSASDVDPLLEGEEQEQAVVEAIDASLDKTASELKMEADAKN